MYCYTSMIVNVYNQPMPVAELLPLTDVSACCAPLTREPISAAEATDLAAQLKAIADPARLSLISMVAAHEDNEACVCELTDPTGKNIDEVRPIRDDIKGRVQELLAELLAATA